jgi:hypothetical protein
MTPACMFFIIARYISMWALLVQVIGESAGFAQVPVPTAQDICTAAGPSLPAGIGSISAPQSACAPDESVVVTLSLCRSASAAVCSLIFLWRTYIIWGRDRRVLFGISACWLGATILACCSIAGSVQCAPRLQYSQ